LPLDPWPEPIRCLWLAAIHQPADPLDGQGRGAGYGRATLKYRRRALGNLLQLLDLDGLLRP
jgi:hypothetical protein